MSPAADERLAAFREAFARVKLPLDDASRAQLEDVVRSYTASKRRAGWSVERTIISLKQEAMHARPPLPASSPLASRGVESALLLHNTIAALVTTCIREYYAVPPGEIGDAGKLPGDAKLIAMVISWLRRRLRSMLRAADDATAWPELVPAALH